MIRTRRTATALTAAAALALGVVPAAFTTTSILAGGEEPTTLGSGAGLQTTPDGYVSIERPIGGADRVALYRATGGAVSSQVIQTGRKDCALVTDPVDTGASALLNFEGGFGSSSGAESWAPGSIGVAEKKSGTS